uniref:Uncharacterized protein n=1 Tax=Rhizophora mucronata TaxID=61149 RepID=A0A2P2JME9_RHIMU
MRCHAVFPHSYVYVFRSQKNAPTMQQTNIDFNQVYHPVLIKGRIYTKTDRFIKKKSKTGINYGELPTLIASYASKELTNMKLGFILKVFYSTGVFFI